MYLGDFAEDATVTFTFCTNAADGGRESFSATLEEADIVIFKGTTAMTLDASTITITTDTGSRTGVHTVSVDMSNDADFTTGSDYHAVLYASDETLDSQAPAGTLACWSCENRSVTVGTNNDKTGYSISGTKTTLDALNDLGQADVTGGAYALDTDANGRMRLVDGTGAGELALTSGFIDGITGTLNTFDDLNNLSTSDIDARLAAIGLDHLLSAAVVGADVADNSIFARLVSSGATADWDDFVNTSDSLQALRDWVGDGSNLTEAGGTGDQFTGISSVGSVTGGINTGAGTITTLDGLDTAQDSQHAVTQAAIGNLSVGSGGISVTNSGFTATTAGTETNDETATYQLDGVLHIVPQTGGNTDAYYEFSVGRDGVPIEVEWHGYAQANGDSYAVYFYNWSSTSWEQVGTIAGGNGSTVGSPLTFSATVAHVGTGANAGLVRWRFASSDGTNFATDRILCTYTVLAAGITNGSTITLTDDTLNQNLSGNGWSLLLNSQTVSGSYFYGAKGVSGTGTATNGSEPIFDRCGIGTVSMSADVFFLRCSLGATLTLTSTAGVTADTFAFNNGGSGVAGSGTPTIDASGVTKTTNLNVRKYGGGLTTVLNSFCTASVEVFEGGAQNITNAAGTINLRAGTIQAIDLTATGASTTNIMASTAYTVTLDVSGTSDTDVVVGSAEEISIATADTAATDVIVGNGAPITISGTGGTVNIFGVHGGITDTSSGTTVNDNGQDIREVGTILANTNELQGDDIPGLIAALPSQADITGGAYALNTDASGNVRIVDGTGANELSLTSGLIDGIAGTIQTLDALDTAQDTQHSTTQSAIATAQSDLDTITGTDGVTLATTQGNYAPAKAGDNMGTVSAVTGGINTAAGTITTLDGLDTAQDSQHSATQTAIGSLNNLSAAQVNAQVDAAIEDYHLDHLLAAAYNPTSKPGNASGLLNVLFENDGGVPRFTANSLEQGPSGSGASAETIADAVLDELLSGHSTAGSLGQALTDLLTGVETDIPATIAALPSQSDITGGAYALDTDANGRVRVVDGTGAGEIDTASGAVIAASLGTQAKADVNAELVDVMDTDTHAEIGQETPAATVTYGYMLGLMYKSIRNKRTQTSASYSLFNDDASTVGQTATVSDDGTTLTVGELTSGA